jgi:DNA repair protein RadC
LGLQKMALKSSPSAANKSRVDSDDIDSHVLGHRKRLKKKFETLGHGGFVDYELLELLLFQVLPRTDTKPLAKELLKKFGSLLGVFSAPDKSLRDIKGVGNSVIHLLKLMHALMGRSLQQDIQGKCVFESWQQVINYCMTTMSYDQKEQLRVLFLDQKNQMLCDEVQQTGTVNHTPIYPREVMKRALEVGATSFILVHNHPTGDPTPSRADIDLTLKLKRIGDDMGVILQDHIIIGQGKHNSLKNMGIL